MKIVCENCGAKYSIADEKVKGKVFKIRCKKCSESILVRGDTPKPEPEPEPKPAPQAASEEEGEAETRVFDYSGGADAMGGGDPIWHIVVDDQQQGPYTEAQIKEYMGSGSISPDTLIWREGFDDWMMAQDVPEFSGAYGGGMPAASRLGGGSLFNDQPGGKLFDDQPATGGGLFGSEAADRSSPFDSGGGLFGDSGGEDVFSSTVPESATGSDGGLFGGGAAQTEGLFAKHDAATAAGESGEGIFSSTREEAPVAAPSPRVSAEQAMLTGQRNENSVLFSLSNLQALAAAPAKEAANPAADFGNFGTAAGGEEASGLIDIRSLAGSINTAEQNDSVDDLISMSAGGFAPALGAPVLAAQNEGMSTNVKIGIIGGAIAALVLIVVVLVVALSGDDEAKTQAEAQIMALQKQIEELSKNSRGGNNDEAIAALQARLKQKQSAAGGSEGDNSAADGNSKTAGKDGDDSKGSASKSKKSSSSSGSSSSRRASSSKSGSSKSSSGASSSSSSAVAQAEPSKPKPKGGSSELDDLLGGATSSKSKPKRSSSSSTSSSSSSSSSGGAKAALSRGDVQTGMGNVAAAVKRCGQGKGGTITMNVMIGKTGRVSSASAVGAFAGTPIGSCAARAVRRARFPASQQTLNVKYPFKL